MESTKSFKFPKFFKKTTSEAGLNSAPESSKRSANPPNAKGGSVAPENRNQSSTPQESSVSERLGAFIVTSEYRRPSEATLQLSGTHGVASRSTDSSSLSNHDSLFLWEQAYINIRKANPDLTAWFEELLAQHSTVTSSDSSFSAPLEFQNRQSNRLTFENLQMCRENMKQILERIFRLNDLDDCVEAGFQHPDVFHTFQDFLWRIIPAAHGSSGAILAWVCIVLAFKVRLRT